MTDGDTKKSFQEQLRSIEELQAHARGYLDRTERHFPDHLDLPRANWRETGAVLSVAGKGERECGLQAIFEHRTPGGYSTSVVLRDPIHCVRPEGHDGPHASSVMPHLFRKTHWKALVWD